MGRHVLIWQRGTMCLVSLNEGTVLLRWEEPEDIRACFLTDEVFFVYRKEQGIELIDCSKQDSSMCFLSEDQPVTALCARSVSETEGFLIIGCKNGSIKSYCVKEKQEENGQWEFFINAVLSEGGESILELDVDEMGGIYAGVLSGIIIRYQKNDSGEFVMDKSYQLEVRCVGAQIDGVYPREQYEILRKAKSE